MRRLKRRRDSSLILEPFITMAEQTKIEWCDSTWNPWIGCTRISPACDDCYAARSTPARTLVVAWGPGQPRRLTSDANWKLPGQWQRQAAAFQAAHGRRRRVFCASLADWLDNEVPIPWLVDLLDLVRTTPALDWLLLTKRIGNWSSRISEAMGYLDEQPLATDPLPLRRWLCQWLDGDEAPRNVWIGSTVVNQAEADRDVPKLLATPAAVRFLSVEPMLGPIDLDLVARKPCRNAAANSINMDPETGAIECCRRCDFTGLSDEWGIDWVICGGESGPKARPMHPDWVRSLRDQCASAGVPFLFKQWGEWLPWHHFSDAAIDDPPERTRFATVEWAEWDWLDVGRPDIWATKDGEIDDMQCMGRVGKKAAGRLLDGRTHDGFPGSAS